MMKKYCPTCDEYGYKKYDYPIACDCKCHA
jgi:hypothetical protein